MYPFRFKIGDVVEITEGKYKGVQGVVDILELSRHKKLAVIRVGNNAPAPVRYPESCLKLIREG
jgi:transcription antitermination factor NusG